MKGVILAAGEGTRIREVTYGAIPKELLPIGNVPTIRFSIESLKLAGIRDIFVVISPQGKYDIVQGLQGGSRCGVNLCYVIQERDENQATGMGKAILSVKNWIGEDQFLVACGDTILCDFSSASPFDCLTPALKFHDLEKAFATVVLQPTNLDPTRFGVVKFKKTKLIEEFCYGDLENLVEKPDEKLAKTFRTNGYNYIIAGYYIFDSRIFSYIEKTKPGVKYEVQITDSISLALKNGEKIIGVINGINRNSKLCPREYWDVGIPEAYKEANTRLTKMNVDKILI